MKKLSSFLAVYLIATLILPLSVMQQRAYAHCTPGHVPAPAPAPGPAHVPTPAIIVPMVPPPPVIPLEQYRTNTPDPLPTVPSPMSEIPVKEPVPLPTVPTVEPAPQILGPLDEILKDQFRIKPQDTPPTVPSPMSEIPIDQFQIKPQYTPSPWDIIQVGEKVTPEAQLPNWYKNEYRSWLKANVRDFSESSFVASGPMNKESLAEKYYQDALANPPAGVEGLKRITLTMHENQDCKFKAGDTYQTVAVGFNADGTVVNVDQKVAYVRLLKPATPTRQAVFEVYLEPLTGGTGTATGGAGGTDNTAKKDTNAESDASLKKWKEDQEKLYQAQKESQELMYKYINTELAAGKFLQLYDNVGQAAQFAYTALGGNPAASAGLSGARTYVETYNKYIAEGHSKETAKAHASAQAAVAIAVSLGTTKGFSQSPVGTKWVNDTLNAVADTVTGQIQGLFRDAAAENKIGKIHAASTPWEIAAEANRTSGWRTLFR